MIPDQGRRGGHLGDGLEGRSDADDKLARVREYIALQNASAKAEKRKCESEIEALRHEIAALKARPGSPLVPGALRRRVGKWREMLRVRGEMSEMRRSGLFDPAWYTARYGDVGRSGIDPLYHYLRYGGFEGRDPNPDFDSDWYSRTYRGVLGEGVNPLLDYIRAGSEAGRDPSPNFRTSWYRQQYPDVAKSQLDPLVHYQRVGRGEGRAPVPTGG